jgi:hypothetical protein
MSVYNHKSQKISEACGMTDTEALTILNHANAIGVLAQTNSQIVQKFEETFTKRELALLAVMFKLED